MIVTYVDVNIIVCSVYVSTAICVHIRINACIYVRMYVCTYVL